MNPREISLLSFAFVAAAACTLEPNGANEADFGAASSDPPMSTSSEGTTGEPTPSSSSTSVDEAGTGHAGDAESTGAGSGTSGSVSTSSGTDGTPLPPTASGGLPTADPSSGCFGHLDRASCEADGCEWASLGAGTMVCADPGVLGTGGVGELCDGLIEANCELLGCYWDGSSCSAEPAGTTGGETR